MTHQVFLDDHMLMTKEQNPCCGTSMSPSGSSPARLCSHTSTWAWSSATMWAWSRTSTGHGPVHPCWHGPVHPRRHGPVHPCGRGPLHPRRMVLYIHVGGVLNIHGARSPTTVWAWSRTSTAHLRHFLAFTWVCPTRVLSRMSTTSIGP